MPVDIRRVVSGDFEVESLQLQLYGVITIGGLARPEVRPPTSASTITTVGVRLQSFEKHTRQCTLWTLTD